MHYFGLLASVGAEAVKLPLPFISAAAFVRLVHNYKLARLQINTATTAFIDVQQSAV